MARCVPWESLLRKIAEMEDHDFELVWGCKAGQISNDALLEDADSVRPDTLWHFVYFHTPGRIKAALNRRL